MTMRRDGSMRRGVFQVLLSCLALAGLLFAAGASLAETAAPPAGEMRISGKKPARFSHSVHLDQGMSCGQCHHDASHQPLSAGDIGAKLAAGGTLACGSCHAPGFANKKLQRRKAVFHGRCRTCHKQGYNGKKGPTRCNGCHIKKKRKKLEGC